MFHTSIGDSPIFSYPSLLENVKSLNWPSTPPVIIIHIFVIIYSFPKHQKFFIQQYVSLFSYYIWHSCFFPFLLFNLSQSETFLKSFSLQWKHFGKRCLFWLPPLTLLFKFLQADFLLLCGLSSATSCLTASSLLSLLVQRNGVEWCTCCMIWFCMQTHILHRVRMLGSMAAWSLEPMSPNAAFLPLTSSVRPLLQQPSENHALLGWDQVSDWPLKNTIFLRFEKPPVCFCSILWIIIHFLYETISLSEFGRIWAECVPQIHPATSISGPFPLTVIHTYATTLPLPCFSGFVGIVWITSCPFFQSWAGSFTFFFWESLLDRILRVPVNCYQKFISWNSLQRVCLLSLSWDNERTGLILPSQPV